MYSDYESFILDGIKILSKNNGVDCVEMLTENDTLIKIYRKSGIIRVMFLTPSKENGNVKSIKLEDLIPYLDHDVINIIKNGKIVEELSSIEMFNKSEYRKFRVIKINEGSEFFSLDITVE